MEKLSRLRSSPWLWMHGIGESFVMRRNDSTTESSAKKSFEDRHLRRCFEMLSRTFLIEANWRIISIYSLST
ncbi:hypothetical protein KY285_010294 [Solanum tuberosum]|nr:hypothetical protein KY289_010836 [Solanum tuberosum]KAH0734587.1 hypothetical protein KY285_010294 [Solanum tuberosum]